MKKQNNEISIKDLLDIFLPKLWIMILVGVLFAGVLSLHSIFVKKDTYTCSALVYVQKTNNNSSTVSTDIEVAEEMVEIFRIAIYEADRFLNTIASKHPEYNLTSASVRSMMTVTPINEAPYLQISVTSTNPDLAYDVAEEIAVSIPELPGQLSANGLQASVFDFPEEPTAPNSKNTVRNALIAFIAGFAVAMAIVFVASMLDTTIRSPKKIEDAFEDVPILAVIPRHEIISVTEEESKDV